MPAFQPPTLDGHHFHTAGRSLAATLMAYSAAQTRLRPPHMHDGVDEISACARFSLHFIAHIKATPVCFHISAITPATADFQLPIFSPPPVIFTPEFASSRSFVSEEALMPVLILLAYMAARRAFSSACRQFTACCLAARLLRLAAFSSRRLVTPPARQLSRFAG